MSICQFYVLMMVQFDMKTGLAHKLTKEKKKDLKNLILK
jgi:hypothetical protein